MANKNSARTKCYVVQNIRDNHLDKSYTEGEFAESELTCKDIDMSELEKGIKIEMEHTDNETMSTKIALDHLSEIPDYYSRLIEMEREAIGDGK